MSNNTHQEFIMYQTGGTLKETLDEVQKRSYVLPAIQREFVWKPEQICRLFDSMMQGYPFGTFLYWKVDKQNSAKYVFYGFVCDYHEKDRPHCPQLPTFHDTDLTAILDGQQRLTALNIGLHGSLALRQRYQRVNKSSSYPTQHLYLNLLSNPDIENEDGQIFQFEFLTEEQSKLGDKDVCWYRVGEILGMENGPAMLEWINQRLPQESTTCAFKSLDRLHRVIHTDHMISYYVEKSQDLDKVLNIFIRMNSGGTVLSYSDLLLSIAVAQWESDARKEIHSLVDDLNKTGEGFDFSKDLILKAGLMLADIGSVGFKVENFSPKNMKTLESQWPGIRDSLRIAVQLVA